MTGHPPATSGRRENEKEAKVPAKKAAPPITMNGPGYLKLSALLDAMHVSTIGQKASSMCQEEKNRKYQFWTSPRKRPKGVESKTTNKHLFPFTS